MVIDAGKQVLSSFGVSSLPPLTRFSKGYFVGFSLSLHTFRCAVGFGMVRDSGNQALSCLAFLANFNFHSFCKGLWEEVGLSTQINNLLQAHEMLIVGRSYQDFHHLDPVEKPLL